MLYNVYCITDFWFLCLSNLKVFQPSQSRKTKKFVKFMASSFMRHVLVNCQNTEYYVNLLEQCVHKKLLLEAKVIHARLVRTGIVARNLACNSLINVYSKIGSLRDATSVFNRTTKRDSCSWTLMLCAMVRNGLPAKALALFQIVHSKTRIKLSKFNYSAAISACTTPEFLSAGLQIHGLAIKGGILLHISVANALVDMYGKCGHTQDARQVLDEIVEPDTISLTSMADAYTRSGLIDEALRLFHRMPFKNAVSFTAMITGVVRQGFPETGLKIFKQMQSHRVEFDAVTLSSILAACSDLEALALGKQIHCQVVIGEYSNDVGVLNALINMYTKSGSLDNAWQVFNRITPRNVISWSSMIAGLAMHGQGGQAMELFERMRASQVVPNGVTFMGVLCGCSHAGMLQEGLKYFKAMTETYGIVPQMEHYRCMVDMLARSGHVDEALNFLQRMPVKPDAQLWFSLLGSPKNPHNAALANSKAANVLHRNPADSLCGVTLSNIYAGDQMKWLTRSQSHRLYQH